MINIATKYGNEEFDSITKEKNLKLLTESNENVKLAKECLKVGISNEQMGCPLNEIKDLYKKAEEYLDDAIKIYKNNAEAYFLLGIICEKKNLFKDAIEEYKKATKLDENYTEANLHLGVLYLLKGDYENARKKFNLPANNNNYAKLCLGLIDYIIVGKGAKQQGLKYIEESISACKKIRHMLPDETIKNIELIIDSNKNIESVINSNKNIINQNPTIPDTIISAIRNTIQQETIRHL